MEPDQHQHSHSLAMDGGGAHAHTIVHPVITINGRVLTDEQAYALRIALSRFQERAESWCIGSDQLAWYQARCAELDVIWMAPAAGCHVHRVADPGLHSHTGIHCHGSQGHWGWKP